MRPSRRAAGGDPFTCRSCAGEARYLFVARFGTVTYGCTACGKRWQVTYRGKNRARAPHARDAIRRKGGDD